MRFRNRAAALLLFLITLTALNAALTHNPQAAARRILAKAILNTRSSTSGSAAGMSTTIMTARSTALTSSKRSWADAPWSRTEESMEAEGKSLFYYQPATKLWKEVWVTDAGPIKEKALIAQTQDGGLRFQGEILHPDGKSHLDRTTLTPLPGDRVHQVIEISRDDGKTWKTVFDAEYRRPRPQ